MGGLRLCCPPKSSTDDNRKFSYRVGSKYMKWAIIGDNEWLLMQKKYLPARD